MTQTGFDDADVRAAMRRFLDAAGRLAEVAAVGGEPRALLDHAEDKALAGLLLRQALERQGWSAPTRPAEVAAG